MKLSDLHSGEGKLHNLRNCLDFITLVESYPELRFFQPSPLKAPWHWQVILRNDMCPIYLNFWPHKGKAYCAEVGRARGLHPIRALIDHALEKNEELSR